MGDEKKIVLAYKAVKNPFVKRLPPALRVRARDAYHRARLRFGYNPLAKPDEHEAFLVAHLPRLGLAAGDGLTYLEFGVYQGASMAAAVRAVDRLGLGGGASFIGFDSFEGLPPDTDDEGWGSGWFITSRSTAEWNLRRQHVVDRVRLVEGWFDETCTPELAEEIGPVHVLMLDCDLYVSTAVALEFAAPNLADRCLAVFDDWTGMNPTESPELGQVKAFAEFRQRNPDWEIERLGSVGHCGVGFLLTRPSAGTTVDGGMQA